MTAKILISETNNPWFNLAIEDFIFNEMSLEHPVLFLWRNQPTVVIGRSQNPWIECHLEKMEQENVLLARRQTGGGAVFHDLGNINFTFLSHRQHYNKDANITIIVNALKSLGIDAQAQGRNDIVVQHHDGSWRKISGSAYRETKDRAFHHGTLLRDVDLSALERYLNPNKKKLIAKGVTSVRARVTNLVEFLPDLSHDLLERALIKSFCSYHNSDLTIEKLNDETLQKISSLNSYYEKIKDWDWRFGKTFEFTHQLEERFDWGSIDMRLQVEQGIVQQVEIFSDALFPEVFDILKAYLSQCRYDKHSFQMQFEKIKSQYIDRHQEIRQLQEFVCGLVG